MGLRRLTAALFALAFFLSLTFGGTAQVRASFKHLRQAESADEQVVIWHIPHPDDETIGMAGGITAAAQRGARNIVVLYTEGKASDARLVLNGIIYCTLHGRFHRPHDEGYEPLDKDAFGRARLLETTVALQTLGVAKEDVLSIGLPDGGVTVAAAHDVMQTLDVLFPNAAHRTTALSDSHPDHRNLARALNTLLQQKRDLGEEADMRFYSVYAYRLTKSRRAANFTSVVVADGMQKDRALDEFAVWDPQAGRFAIGMHSVPRLITNAALDPFEYAEDPPTVLKRHHLRPPRVAFNVLNDQAAIQLRIAPAVFTRLGVLYAGQRLVPAVFYEAPTYVSAIKLRIGIARSAARPAPGRPPAVDPLAGLRIFDHLLVEYRPGSSFGASIRFGVKFTL